MHGLGEMNEAGKEFLNFLLLNEATICNTQFAKKHIHMAASKIQKMALHRLCSDEAEGQEEVLGCSSQERSRMPHGPSTVAHQGGDDQQVVSHREEEAETCKV